MADHLKKLVNLAGRTSWEIRRTNGEFFCRFPMICAGDGGAGGVGSTAEPGGDGLRRCRRAVAGGIVRRLLDGRLLLPVLRPLGRGEE